MSEDTGAQLYSAVERIVDEPAKIIAWVESIEDQLDEEQPDMDDGEFVEEVADRIIQSFANKTMYAGGLSAAPAILPVFGTILALVPGNLADMTLCLKYEVEMVMSLSVLYGFDIKDDHERSLAFLMASVSTYELMSNDRGVVKDAVRSVTDIAHAETQAVWNYTPRQVGKYLTKIFLQLALKGAGKGLFKAIPILGIGVAALSNRILTQRVGEQARSSLRYRVACEAQL